MAKKIAQKDNPPKKAKSAQEKVHEFVEAYLLNFNASAAYLAVFERVVPSSAPALASRYLNDANVQQYLKQRLKERRDQLHLDQAYVVRKLTEIVETDFTQASTAMSNAQLNALPVEVRKLVQSVKLKKSTNTFTNSNGNDSESVNEEYEVTFMSKDRALESLGKHTGAFAKDNAIAVGDLSKMSYTAMMKAMSEIPDDDE